MLMENLQNKNPQANDGWTPLHEAAKNGKTETCKIIMFLNKEICACKFYIIVIFSHC